MIIHGQETRKKGLNIILQNFNILDMCVRYAYEHLIYHIYVLFCFVTAKLERNYTTESDGKVSRTSSMADSLADPSIHRERQSTVSSEKGKA